jgi:hypothetical protein
MRFFPRVTLSMSFVVAALVCCPAPAAQVAAADPAACGCRPEASWQQPPWHGNVHAAQCGVAQPCCPGSSVFQANPFQQLHMKHHACAPLPPCLPRLHSLLREGYMPSPVPPTQPRCHQCGAPIAGGF